MKKVKILLNLLVITLFSLSMYGQDNFEIIQLGDSGMTPRFIEFNKKAVTFTSTANYLKNVLKVRSSNDFILLNQTMDNLGFTHYRLQQTINGIPVAYSMYLIHVKNNLITAANGEWFSDIPSKLVTNKASLTSAEALVKAKQLIKANTYAWEVATTDKHGDKVFMDEEISDQGELVYISKNNVLNPSQLRLAYKFDMYSVVPMGRKLVYIDAITGNTLFVEQKMHSADTGGTTDTGFYGSRSITVSNGSNGYVVKQTGDRKISLKDLNGASLPQTQSAPNANLISSSSTSFNFSGNKKYHMAAYWGAEQTWDMYQNTFNRSSYDGNGANINIYVNASGQGADNNAFWMGSWTYFGNSSNGGTPFTPLDVVGHEITHGVTQQTAGLVYQGESGALNESFSDILGSYAEYYAFNTIDEALWTIGDKISLKRSLSNPKSHNQPDTYQGSKWASTSGGDNGGVHTNSGVMNHWFYLTSQGGTGTNDQNDSYTIDGIGIEKAGKIAYRALVNYLSSNSNYISARNAVINAAKDLYGANSCEEKSVTDAMYAVGVGAQYSGSGCGTSNGCDAVIGISSTNITTSAAAISWTAVSGISDYTLEYKTNSAASYISVTASVSPNNLSGLTANTTYNVRLKYTCAGGENAPYSTMISFTTLSDSTGSCNAVTGVSSANITTSAASISWNVVPNISNYTVEYKTASASSYTSTSAGGSSKGLSGLTADTTYNVRLKYNCSGGGSDPCDGISPYQSGVNYQVGDKVTYQDSLYQRTNSGWTNLGACGATGGEQNSPYSSVISFTTLKNTTGPCDGISEYQYNVYYYPGDKVTYQGGGYQMNYYSQWVYLGTCNAFSISFATKEGAVIPSGLLSIHPNPAVDYVTISLNGATTDSVSVNVYDLNGRIVLHKVLHIIKGMHSSKINVSNLKSGIYLLNIDGHSSKKLIIK
ncbi:MAG: M4 family metallopeptidase [Flavobacteriaceae bacterium]|nr:M4 family metallopeptidase [Flavobacteriaceae bacterium]